MYVFNEQKPTYLKSVSYCKVSYCTVSEVLKYVSDPFFFALKTRCFSKKMRGLLGTPCESKFKLIFSAHFHQRRWSRKFCYFCWSGTRVRRAALRVALQRHPHHRPYHWVNQFFLIAQRLEKTLKFAYQVHHKIFHSRQEILPSSNPRFKFSRGVSEVKNYPFWRLL